jgi:hypothetical protein
MVYLKERREIIEKGGSVEKVGAPGGFGQTAIPYLSIRTEEGEGSTERAGRQGCSPAVQCMATPGRWGKTERRPRGSQPCAYLGLRWFVGAAQREGVVVQWRGGDGSVVQRDWRRAIYSQSKALRGDIPCGELAGEGGALAGPWWPTGILVAGRRHGSCRATRRLGWGVGRPRRQWSSMRSDGSMRRCGRHDGRGGAELGWRWS